MGLTYEKLLEVKQIMLDDTLRNTPKWCQHLHKRGLVSDEFVFDKHNQIVMDDAIEAHNR